ncbi:MAG: TIGR01212 family radical SAM protein [Bacteroidales bacterium]|jgi:radical SAM protein (TIGR01212 family)|nr:TIGR01212 family radical SAM protein [Bacteroidales bacterium]NLM93201.1 TIGR01212 family radical SAM protein [Bacteroidales bacterium]
MNHLWGNQRRFNSWADRCRQKYGSRLQRVSIHAGFTCPNRDGTIGYGGCTFCNNEGFSPAYCKSGNSIAWQIDQGVYFLNKRYKNPEKFIAYFQAYTNTHGSLEWLKSLYGEALAHPDIWGLAIGTRPDCVDDEKLDYFAELARERFVSIEYGIESCCKKTLGRVNRGHSFEDSARAIEQTASRGLHTGGHLIFGLPGETREQMLAQAEVLSALPLSTLKFHQLQIVRNTPMALEYEAHPEHFELFSLEEYVAFMVSFLERLRPDISIERLSGEVPMPYQLSPGWGRMRSDQIIRMIEKRMEERDTWQGKLWQG